MTTYGPTLSMSSDPSLESSIAMPSLSEKAVPATMTTSVSKSTTVHIGTRKSALALAQTNIVHEALKAAHPTYTFEIHAMSTMGDKNQITPLHDFGAKALWTHELEAGLLENRLDIIVHSLKDMPTQLPPNCVLGCVMNRADPHDAVVMKAGLSYKRLAELPPGSIVGTSSVRRSAQISRKYPDLKFKDVRGNINTRLAKLDAEDSEYACLILAAAGLQRINFGGRITQLLDSKTPGGGLLHAVGQGALGIEIREGDERISGLLEELIDKDAMLACLSERSLMRTLEGGCSVPIGVETEWVEKGKLLMKAIVVSLDGKDGVETQRLGEVLFEKDAEELGVALAQDLVEKGAGKILDAINANRNVPAQGGA